MDDKSIERVARAIAKAMRYDFDISDYDRGREEPWRDEFLDAARAVIDALRVVRPDVALAGSKEAIVGLDGDLLNSEEVWAVMIHAILNPQEKSNG